MNAYTLEGKIVIKGNPVIHLFRINPNLQHHLQK